MPCTASGSICLDSHIHLLSSKSDHLLNRCIPYTLELLVSDFLTHLLLDCQVGDDRSGDPGDHFAAVPSPTGQHHRDRDL